MFIIVWIYVLLWICHLHLFSFGSIYVLLWISCSTSRYNGTQIYTRTYTYTRACPNFNRASGRAVRAFSKLRNIGAGVHNLIISVYANTFAFNESIWMLIFIDILFPQINPQHVSLYQLLIYFFKGLKHSLPIPHGIFYFIRSITTIIYD